jgi:hypothetical protein
VTETDSASKEVVKRLALFLKQKMPELQEVLEDWPEPNIALKYPALSIFSGPPVIHRHLQTVKKTIEEIDGEDVKSSVKYVVGDYEWRMQLDIWSGSKPERHRLYESFYRAFNDQFVRDEMETLGISLRLENYHNIIARYNLVSFAFDDSEAGSQRKEWRTKIVVLVNCDAILEKEQFKIVETQVEYDIGTDVII